MEELGEQNDEEPEDVMEERFDHLQRRLDDAPEQAELDGSYAC